MYNFEEIKEVIIPYLEGLYTLSFIMHPYRADNEVLYSKDDVLIVAHNNLDDRFIECLGLTEDHEKILSDIVYKFHKDVNEEFEYLEKILKDNTPDMFDSMTEEECNQYIAEMEELQAQEAAEFEDSVRYYDVIGNDYEALYGCLRSSLIRHTEELLTLVDHTADTMACELQVSVQDVERIMSRLRDKIKETTNL